MTFDKIKYDNDYVKDNYDRLSIFVKKGMKDEIKKYSKEKGYKSVNKYIEELVLKDMYNNNKADVNIETINNNDGGTINIGK